LIRGGPEVSARQRRTMTRHDTACTTSGGEDGRHHPQKLGSEGAASSPIQNAPKFFEESDIESIVRF